MAEKAPCRHLGDDWFCGHPLAQYLSTQIGDAGCYPDGCPCHEPEPAKDTTQKGDGDAVATD